jgi:hypothetical protein
MQLTQWSKIPELNASRAIIGLQPLATFLPLNILFNSLSGIIQNWSKAPKLAPKVVLTKLPLELFHCITSLHPSTVSQQHTACLVPTRSLMHNEKGDG